MTDTHNQPNDSEQEAYNLCVDLTSTAIVLHNGNVMIDPAIAEKYLAQARIQGAEELAAKLRVESEWLAVVRVDAYTGRSIAGVTLEAIKSTLAAYKSELTEDKTR